MKTLLSIFVLSSLLLLSACSTITEMKSDLSDKFFGREPAEAPEPLAEIKQTVVTNLLWQAKIGAAEDSEFTPVIEAGYAYAASAAGELLKLDASNGSQAWRVNIGQKITGGVGVGGSGTAAMMLSYQFQ